MARSTDPTDLTGIDAIKDNLKVGVVGAGTMGRGIAQVVATSGWSVKLFDIEPENTKNACRFIEKMLARAVEKKRMSSEQAKASMANVSIVDSMAGLCDCQIIIEAATENLDIKRKIFDELETVAGDQTILATNTSSLSVTTIASRCRHPERIAGLHFFNPVPIMKLVEVVGGVRTATWVTEFLYHFGRRLSLEPVRVTDTPGFLVNQVGRGFTIEAAHLLNEGIATFADIDRIMRDAAGFPMGPFELMDLTAIDVTQPATELIYEQFYHEPRYRPSTLMKTRMDAGLLGRKTGRGFYKYEGNNQLIPAHPPAPSYDNRPIWLAPAQPEISEKLMALLKNLGAVVDNGKTAGDQSLILITPLGTDATTTAHEMKLDPKRSIAIDTLFRLDKHRTLMKTPVTASPFTMSAQGLFASDGTPVTIIRDSAGFVSQRIVAMIVNIGCSIAQTGSAIPEDIDKAVKLGLGYPHGPLTFGDILGADKILQILNSIFACTGDPRYRPTPWLKRRALLGISLLTSET